MTQSSHTAEELAELDIITRQIDIDASPARVWALIVRPGWYVNEGIVEDQQDLRYERDDAGREVGVVTHPTLGEFRFRTVELDEPRYAAFRWLGTTFGEANEGTLVEFWIGERDGGVTLRVKESGFSTLCEDPAVWLKEREDHDSGWTQEVAAAKTYVEARA